MSDRPLLDKLGVKDNHTVITLGVRDTAFVDALAARAAKVSTRRRHGVDMIFLACETADDLSRIADVKTDLKDDGALWVVRPKGVKAITERQVMEAGLAAGLVDVKVVAFSPTHTAEKFVYRLKDRGRR